MNRSIASCAESWHKRASSVKPLGHPRQLQTRRSGNLGGRPHGIQTVNWTWVCFTFRLQREKKALICQKKIKPCKERQKVPPRINAANLRGSFGVQKVNRKQGRTLQEEAAWVAASSHTCPHRSPACRLPARAAPPCLQIYAEVTSAIAK